MTRAETTEFLSNLLICTKFSGMGKYWAREVSLDYGTKDVKRVDFMQFTPENTSISGLEKGVFTCYEIKSCKADVFSGHGLNFEGEKNYIVTTMQTWKDLIADGSQNKLPYNVGVLVACIKEKYKEFEDPTPLDSYSYMDGWRLETMRCSHYSSRKRSMTELLFCMLRSGTNKGE